MGGKRHSTILDILDSLTSQEEEDLVRLVMHGWTQRDIADEFGQTQGYISKRLKKILNHAF